MLCSLSEHDFKDLKDLQDGIVSCPSFHPLNRVQDEGAGWCCTPCSAVPIQVDPFIRIIKGSNGFLVTGG